MHKKITSGCTNARFALSPYLQGENLFFRRNKTEKNVGDSAFGFQGYYLRNISGKIIAIINCETHEIWFVPPGKLTKNDLHAYKCVMQEEKEPWMSSAEVEFAIPILWKLRFLKRNGLDEQYEKINRFHERVKEELKQYINKEGRYASVQDDQRQDPDQTQH